MSDSNDLRELADLIADDGDPWRAEWPDKLRLIADRIECAPPERPQSDATDAYHAEFQRLRGLRSVTT